jgi:hypothetical protein
MAPPCLVISMSASSGPSARPPPPGISKDQAGDRQSDRHTHTRHGAARRFRQN